MMKVIMILGAGMMQLPAFKAARKNGWITVAADGNPDAPCRKLADHFIAVDLKDRTKLAEEALLFRDKIGLDGVFTCGTDFSTSVAWVGEQLNLPGISYKTALNCTDKIRMRTLFREQNIACPNFIEVSPDMDILQTVSGLTFPLVVKPVDNMGGRGVIRVEESEDLTKAVKEAIRYSRTDRAIVEEFMEGPEFSIDSLVYDQNIYITGFADRHIYFPPCFIEMGHTLPTDLAQESKEEVIRVFKKAVEALGITHGAAKGDIKFTPKGVMIGEIAARLSGGYMSGWTYPYASDVFLVEKGMMIALGEDPGDLSESGGKTSSERAFISIPGRIRAIENIEEAHSVEGVRDLFLRVEEGDSVIFPENNVTKCGNVIALGETREQALASSEGAVKKIRIILEEDSDETLEFMESPLGNPFPPSAYSCMDQQWCQSVGLMDFKPDFSMKYSIHPVPVPGKDDSIFTLMDWHSITVREALEEIRAKGRIPLDIGTEWTLFSRHFWYSLLRGGIQGAYWFLSRNEDR